MPNAPAHGDSACYPEGPGLYRLGGVTTSVAVLNPSMCDPSTCACVCESVRTCWRVFVCHVCVCSDHEI